jgi:hypothetical protein
MKKKIAIVFSVFAILIGGYFGRDAYKEYQATTAIEERNVAKLKRRERVESLLKDAKAKADQAVIKRALEFNAFIDSKKPGAKPFSKDVVSLTGVWNAGKCKLPGMAPNCYEQYISDKFNQHIFTPEDFRDATSRAIKGGVQDIESIENHLAVALQEVIVGRSLTPTEQPLEVAKFKSAIESARRSASDGVVKEAGGLVAAEVFTQITTQVAIRLGVSAGIWTMAASSSWWTLGGSVFIGLIANAIWNYYSQPAQKVEATMIVELDKMGSGGSAVIRDELTKKVAARSQFWQTTVNEKLQ